MHIWIFAGGTGGHIAPGVALASTFIEKGHTITLITTKKELTYPDIIALKQQNPPSKLSVTYYSSSKKPNSLKTLWLFMVSLLRSYVYLNQLHGNNKVHTIIGMGGYTSLNGLLWGLSHRIPIFLCEQNTVMGQVNALFAHLSKKVFLSFPLDNMRKHYMLSGNPLKANFFHNITQKRNISFPPKTICLLGGSQGAQDINQLYIKMIQDSFFQNIHIIISVGEDNFENMKSIFRKQDQGYPFIINIQKVLSQVDCLIARAGSGTLFEVLATKPFPILLPYPHATDNHQYKNAYFLEKHKQAIVIHVNPFQVDTALKHIKSTLSSPTMMQTIYHNLTKFNSLPMDAHNIITEVIEQTI